MGTQLSQKDKQHWRDLIAKKIDKRIDGIKAACPSRFSNLAAQAYNESLKSLGLVPFYTKEDTLTKQIRELEQQKEKNERAMIAHLRNVPPDTIERYTYNCRSEVQEAVEKRAATHLDALMQADDLGQQVLALEAEKEDLLNSVYLATATSQIKDLYASVLKLIDETPTTLTGAAMAITPVKED